MRILGGYQIFWKKFRGTKNVREIFWGGGNEKFLNFFFGGYEKCSDIHHIYVTVNVIVYNNQKCWRLYRMYLHLGQCGKSLYFFDFSSYCPVNVVNFEPFFTLTKQYWAMCVMNGCWFLMLFHKPLKGLIHYAILERHYLAYL